MKEIRFEGYSDDTFMCQGPLIDVDFDTCASGNQVFMRVLSPETGDGLIVCGQYAPEKADGWLIGISPHDPEHEDRPMPSWAARFEKADAPYSPCLVVEVPDDVIVELLR